MANRAKNVPEVEYELLKHLLSSVNITPLEAVMATDEHSRKRFTTGVANIIQLIDNMADRRLHRLPKDHPDYKAKE
jgi:hypothetical protein